MHQLLNQYPEMLPPCHTKRTGSGEPVLRSIDRAKKLFEDFCSIPEKIYIIIDGLDECEQLERKQLLDFLVGVVTQSDTSDPGKLRVMVVSQEYGDIKRALHSPSSSKIVPSIVIISEADNRHDIKSYVRFWVDKIAAKHEPFDNEAKEYLRNLTVARAKGIHTPAQGNDWRLTFQACSCMLSWSWTISINNPPVEICLTLYGRTTSQMV